MVAFETGMAYCQHCQRYNQQVRNPMDGSKGLLYSCTKLITVYIKHHQTMYVCVLNTTICLFHLYYTSMLFLLHIPWMYNIYIYLYVYIYIYIWLMMIIYFRDCTKKYIYIEINITRIHKCLEPVWGIQSPPDTGNGTKWPMRSIQWLNIRCSSSENMSGYP